MSERRMLIVSLVAGTILRVVHTATSLGSLDAFMWFRWVELTERVGILRSYLYSDLMNHPPFALAIARVTNAIGTAFGLEFQHSFRLLQTAADVVTALVLVRITRRLALANPTAPAILFFLSPAAIFITGFHCNSDPLMMMFLALAVAAVLEERPVPAGLALAAAVGVKILPLLVAPLLLLALRGIRERVRFVVTAAVATTALFLPGFIVSGPLFLKQVFGYTGMRTGWGLRLLVPEAAAYGSIVALLAIATLWIVEWRRGFDPARLPALITVTYLIVIFLAPGFGVQYLFWPLVFLAFAVGRRPALLFHGLASVFAFALYTEWADGWPWWYADGDAPGEETRLLAYLGIVLWVAIGLTAIHALRRLYARHSSSSSSPTAFLYFLVLL